MSGHKKMLSPRAHIALVLQLRETADLLERMPPAQCCLNCSNLIVEGDRRVCGKVLQSIPTDYSGEGCKLWTEEVPF